MIIKYFYGMETVLIDKVQNLKYDRLGPDSKWNKDVVEDMLLYSNSTQPDLQNTQRVILRFDVRVEDIIYERCIIVYTPIFVMSDNGKTIEHIM